MKKTSDDWAEEALRVTPVDLGFNVHSVAPFREFIERVQNDAEKSVLSDPTTSPEGTTWMNCVVLNLAASRNGDKEKSKKLMDLIFLLEEIFPEETMAERKKWEK